jgi:HSP20 family protein
LATAGAGALIDVKSPLRIFRAAIDSHQGGTSCTRYDAIAAVKPSKITAAVGCCGALKGGFRMAMLRWEPFRELENALSRFSALYMPDNGAARNESAAKSWVPLANISETENEYLIKIELPDVKKEDVKIAVADGVITISGERKLEREDKGENEIRVESIYGAFTRSFVLPDSVDANGIRAEAKDGVLRIHVPKVKTKRSEPLAIEVH